MFALILHSFHDSLPLNPTNDRGKSECQVKVHADFLLYSCFSPRHSTYFAFLFSLTRKVSHHMHWITQQYIVVLHFPLSQSVQLGAVCIHVGFSKQKINLTLFLQPSKISVVLLYSPHISTLVRVILMIMWKIVPLSAVVCLPKKCLRKKNKMRSKSIHDSTVAKHASMWSK